MIEILQNEVLMANLKNVGSISSNPMILSGSILMALGVVIPCLFWFIRNFSRIVLKKDAYWFNKVLLILAIFGLIIFILGLVLLIIPIVQGK